MEPDSSSASPRPAASSRVPPLDWAQRSGRAAAVTRGIETFVRRQRRRRALAIASAAALVALSCGVAVMRRPVDPSAAGRSPATAAMSVTSPERQTLPDGSIVDLRPGAELSVAFAADDAGLRRVVLRRGEAHFTVAKDPHRPFVVEVDGVEVRAVGTAFLVNRAAGKVEVLVTEGKVALDGPATATPTDAGAGRTPLARLGVGDQALVAFDAGTAKASVAAVSPAETHLRLAWRVPRLEFNATPLAEVIALFNRHAVAPDGEARTRLVLADDSLANLPLSGMLRADNVAVLLQIVASAYGIRAEHEPDGVIVLRRGP